METFRAQFDGRVLVPEQPVNLPTGQPLQVYVAPLEQPVPAKKPLERLAELAKQFPDNPDAPTDAAAQHDHYLYGTPNRP